MTMRNERVEFRNSNKAFPGSIRPIARLHALSPYQLVSATRKPCRMSSHSFFWLPSFESSPMPFQPRFTRKHHGENAFLSFLGPTKDPWPRKFCSQNLLVPHKIAINSQNLRQVTRCRFGPPSLESLFLTSIRVESESIRRFADTNEYSVRNRTPAE